MPEEPYILAFKQLRRAVRKGIANNVENTVKEKISSIQKELSILGPGQKKSEEIRTKLTDLSKKLIKAQSGKAKEKREAARELEEYLKEIDVDIDVKKNNHDDIKKVVGKYRVPKGKKRRFIK
jgi:predicted enzyme involved in methoxymalonyl-ACP biosynthesis